MCDDQEKEGLEGEGGGGGVDVDGRWNGEMRTTGGGDDGWLKKASLSWSGSGLE